MQYESVELLRGVWGLEARLYTADEIAQSFHLTSALHAGAFQEAGDHLVASDTQPLPKSQVETIDLRDNVSEQESEFAARTLRQRRKEKES